MKAYEAGVWAFLARACRNHSPNLSNRSVLSSFYMVARRAFMATSRKSNDVDAHAFHVKPKNVLLCLFVRPRYTEPHMRASPSGKASASQADIRGFESRCPLHAIQKSRESGSFFVGFWRGNGARTRKGASVKQMSKCEFSRYAVNQLTTIRVAFCLR